MPLMCVCVCEREKLNVIKNNSNVKSASNFTDNLVTSFIYQQCNSGIEL